MDSIFAGTTVQRIVALTTIQHIAARTATNCAPHRNIRNRVITQPHIDRIAPGHFACPGIETCEKEAIFVSTTDGLAISPLIFRRTAVELCVAEVSVNTAPDQVFIGIAAHCIGASVNVNQDRVSTYKGKYGAISDATNDGVVPKSRNN
ncbi:MAG TPA: hypothetical protein PKZ35_13810 [Gammaproteobacteria bacterium]|nr:hypothetical protein [Gammaproteobacteria bacterium]